MRLARHGRSGRTRVPPGEIDHPRSPSSFRRWASAESVASLSSACSFSPTWKAIGGPLIAQPSSVIHRRSLAEKAAHAGPAERVLGDHPEEPGRQPAPALACSVLGVARRQHREA